MSAQARPGSIAPGLNRLQSWLGKRPLLQLGVLAGLIAGALFLGDNLISNMDRVGITPGFSFLWRPANFEIGETLIAYSAQSSFGRAILAGALNTALVSIAGCILATLIGVAIGLARISANPVVAGMARIYVETIRNTPLLLQLFFWSATVQTFPPIRRAFEPLPGLLFSNRGLFLPSLGFSGGAWAIATAAVTAILLTVWALLRLSMKDRPRERRRAGFLLLLAAGAGLAVLAALGGFSVGWPQQKGFNVTGGLAATPEFAALLFGLAVNSSAGIAEIVRSGIEAVPKGQIEAARALGLRQRQIMRLVILPQALRIMTPLFTSSYLSLTKNSSLAVAIGYPDLVSIVNTTANQTGQALEAIMIMIGIYLTINLTVSLVMNRAHARRAGTVRG